MLKKSADGFIISFRLGTNDGVCPGMTLTVLNEEGFPLGAVTVLKSSETESEARVSGESGIKLGCFVQRPKTRSAINRSAPDPSSG